MPVLFERSSKSKKAKGWRQKFSFGANRLILQSVIVDVEVKRSTKNTEEKLRKLKF